MIYKDFPQIFPYLYYKNKDTGEKFPSFYEAAIKTKNLILNRNYKVIRGIVHKKEYWDYYRNISALIMEGAYERETIFKEIVACPYIQPEEMTYYLSKEFEFKSTNLNDLSTKYVNGIKIFLYENLEKDKTYVIPHSGGYDSRILSGILFDVVREMGEKFENFKFITWKPEIEESRYILNQIGWNEENFIPIREIDSDADYFSSMFFDLKTIGGNQPNVLSIDSPSCELSILLEKYFGHVHNLIFLSAAFADEMLHSNRLKFGNMSSWLASQLMDRKQNLFISKYMFPNLSKYSVDLLSKFHVGDKVMLFKTTCVEKIKLNLSTLKNPRWKILKKKREEKTHMEREISKETIDVIKENIKNSWFYNNFKDEIDPDFIIPNFIDESCSIGIWKHYSKISLCEYLISRDCNIKGSD